MFPGFGTNLPTQLWIASRYLEGLSFLIASVLLISPGAWSIRKNTGPAEKVRFAWEIFLIYAGVCIFILLSIFVFRIFPDSYLEGVGLTTFKIISEYIISLILICSLFLLYFKRDRFEKHVFRLLAASIILTALAELAFTMFTYVDDLSFAVGHYFKLLSFYLIYMAIVSTGFSEPYNLLFRELKQSEEALRQKTFFLQDDQGRIYKMLGVQIGEPESEPSTGDSQSNGKDEKDYSPLVQNIKGLIVFRFDEHSGTNFMDGAVKEITGYGKEDFLSRKVKWAEIVVPEDQPLIFESINRSTVNPDLSTETEYRIRRKDGEIKWVREVLQKLPGNLKNRRQFQGFIHDITERKRAEETLQKIEKVRIKEIHHRIKNNLQVISSLLSLEAEKFSDAKMLEAFRESQNRVVSMALIHEELYKGEELDTLDFSAYLRELTADLLNSYLVGGDRVNLKLDLEQAHFGMDIAIPLGIIVNELVSNALKHAFPAGQEGEIRISLHRAKRSAEKFAEKPSEKFAEKSAEEPAPGASYSDEDLNCGKDFDYMLTVADNGIGIPGSVDYKNIDSLGLQLVNVLVEQIDGCVELESDQGTKFIIGINIAEEAEIERSRI